jgi:pimeloyl-ACP methyl ester carboxylesterase
MPTARANDIEIEYETFGDRADPVLLLVMGFAAQLITWNEKLCRALAERRRFVVRFDNRDVGLSTHLDGVEVDIGELVKAVLQRETLASAPYKLSDMAADAVGLLDHLGVDRAHVVGASMGGMIAQTMAIEHSERLLTLTSIMSSTGEPEVGQASPEAMAALMSPPPTNREEAIERFTNATRIVGSPRYFDEAQVREFAGVAFDRAFYPEGAVRQLAAVAASGSRAEQLPDVRTPTLVIHGRCDPLIDPSGGLRTAELVPEADLLVLHDMGHDLPEVLWPRLVDAVISHQEHATR